jgi:hypothetical protein
MEAKTRRQVVVLAVLLTLLTVALWWNLGRVAEAPATVRTAPRTAQPARAAAIGDAPVETLRLDALAKPRPTPESRGRDPFRFQGRVEDTPAPETSQPSEVAGTPTEVAPPVPAGPPPIPLRFIGVVRTGQGKQLIAVLSDGTAIYRGGEGDIIEGRYKVVRVQLDSVELAYLDGRGQQVLRPSGS